MRDQAEANATHTEQTPPIWPLAQKWRKQLGRAIIEQPADGAFVIVVPHPDDEVLTTGGLISALCRRQQEVMIIAVTDGGSAYPDTVEHDDLAAHRRREQSASLRKLGLTDACVTRLGVRDGSVDRHEAAVADAIAELSGPGTTIIAPWTDDVHPDHEAVGRAALEASRRVGAHLRYSLFWAWHRHDPSVLDEVRLIERPIAESDRARKAAALACHRSQLDPPGTEPILDPSLLEPALWASEYFIREPEATSRT